MEEDAEKDPNWRAFREARKKDKAEREAAERRAAQKEEEVAALKAAMEAAFGKGNNPRASQTGYSEGSPIEETEEERIEKRVQAAIEKREAQLEKERRIRDEQELPYRLKQAFPDYDQVVNEENGAYLEYHHPEVYRSLLRQPQNFDTLSDTYKIVKKLIPNSINAKKEAAKADANINKPKSISSTGLTQTKESTSTYLTEDRKAANWERMKKLMNGVS